MRCATLMLALLAVGCVSSGKYDALQKQLDQTRATLSGQLDEKERRIAALEEQIRVKDAQIAVARAGAEMDVAEIARLEVQQRQLQSELAALVRDRSSLKASTEVLEAALAETARRKAESDRRVFDLRRLLGQLQTMIDAGTLKVKIVDGRMVLALGTDVLFPTGSAELSPSGLRTIQEVTAILLDAPERRLQVEGHTDAVPINNARFRSNWELGAGRAITIVNTMIAAGVDPKRVSAASFGEHRPVAGNDSDPGRAANRRIEIVIVPDLSLLPGFDELRQAIEERLYAKPKEKP